MANDSKVALLCAYTLASAERYGEAEALILSDPELAKTPEAMDLLARVRTEQGDCAEARRLWQEIQSIYPEHKPSAAALKALMKHPKRFSCRAMWYVSLLGALLFGLVLGGTCCSCMGSARAQVATEVVTWDRLPGEAQLTKLDEHYRGKVARVLVSSAFFNRADRVSNRALFVEFLASALALPVDAIYMGPPQPGQVAESIRVELELK